MWVCVSVCVCIIAHSVELKWTMLKFTSQSKRACKNLWIKTAQIHRTRERMSKQSREKQQKDQKYKEKHVPNVQFRVNPTKSGMKTNENVTKSELLNSRKSRVPPNIES